MAKKFRFKKPKNMSVVMTEVISLAVWLVFGDKVIVVLNNLVGETNTSVFVDAFKFLGIGTYTTDATVTAGTTSNASNGLLGIVALVMVAMILMNFISYK